MLKLSLTCLRPCSASLTAQATSTGWSSWSSAQRKGEKTRPNFSSTLMACGLFCVRSRTTATCCSKPFEMPNRQATDATVIAVDENRHLFAARTALGTYCVMRRYSGRTLVAGEQFVLPTLELGMHVLRATGGTVVALNVTPHMAPPTARPTGVSTVGPALQRSKSRR